MRIIAHIFSIDVKKWFCSLVTNFLNSSQQLIELFLARWQENKNPLHILAEYIAMKRNPNEIVQEFTTRFNLVYNSIPNDIKPPLSLSLLYYPDAFDQDMTYQLRERDRTNLEEIKHNAISVEANLLIKKSKIKLEKPEKKVTVKEEPSSSSEGKLDTLIKTMERMMERMTISNRQVEPLIRNLNYRGQQQSQFRNKQKEQKNQDPQGQIRKPFQQNYTQGSKYDEEEIAEANHLFEEDESPTFLIEEGQFFQEPITPSDQQIVLANDDSWAMQTREYQRGYQNSLNHLQKQYNLRSINVPITLHQKRQNVLKDTPDKEATPAHQKRENENFILSQDKIMKLLLAM